VRQCQDLAPDNPVEIVAIVGKDHNFDKLEQLHKDFQWKQKDGHNTQSSNIPSVNNPVSISRQIGSKLDVIEQDGHIFSA